MTIRNLSTAWLSVIGRLFYTDEECWLPYVQFSAYKNKSDSRDQHDISVLIAGGGRDSLWRSESSLPSKARPESVGSTTRWFAGRVYECLSSVQRGERRAGLLLFSYFVFTFVATNFVTVNFHDFTRFLIDVPSSPYELRYKRSLRRCMRIMILRSAIINILILCPLINRLNKVDSF